MFVGKAKPAEAAFASKFQVCLLAGFRPGLLLALCDFGPGVDAEQLARLTEPFHRTDSAHQRATGGVGLGMYLCQLVAQAHGSRLQVDNAALGLCVQLLLKE